MEKVFIWWGERKRESINEELYVANFMNIQYKKLLQLKNKKVVKTWRYSLPISLIVEYLFSFSCSGRVAWTSVRALEGIKCILIVRLVSCYLDILLSSFCFCSISCYWEIPFFCSGTYSEAFKSRSSRLYSSCIVAGLWPRRWKYMFWRYTSPVSSHSLGSQEDPKMHFLPVCEWGWTGPICLYITEVGYTDQYNFLSEKLLYSNCFQILMCASSDFVVDIWCLVGNYFLLSWIHDNDFSLACSGYWDSYMCWIKTKINIEELSVVFYQDFLKTYERGLACRLQLLLRAIIPWVCLRLGLHIPLD